MSSLSSKIQIDDRPTAGDCTILLCETSFKEHLRIIAEVGGYDTDEPDIAQGIDLHVAEAEAFVGLLSQYASSRDAEGVLIPNLQLHRGTHSISLTPGIEGKACLTIGYHDSSSSHNQMVSIYLSPSECTGFAYLIRSGICFRRIGDSESELDRQADIEGWSEL